MAYLGIYENKITWIKTGTIFSIVYTYMGD